MVHKNKRKLKKVMVTGASGFIASWVVKRLLEEGIEVHGTVRSLDNPAKIDHLRQLDHDLPGRLKLFEADLLQDGSFNKAAEGCDTIFHLASPFVPFKVENPQRDLIEPAVKGTANVLEAASVTRSVERVVLTSSVAAIMGDASDSPADEREQFTEDDWNTTSSVDHQPYAYSKTMAEREAWRLAAEQDRWELVVVNPGFVLGPTLSRRSDSTSTGMMLEFLQGEYSQGVPALSFGIVDVRDVAEAQYRAATLESAEGRHILTGTVMGMWEISQLIAKLFPDRFPLPKKELPKLLLYLFGPARGFSWRYIRRNIGYPLQIDNAKSRRALGIEYRPPEETIRDQIERLLEAGLLDDAKSDK